MVVAGCPLGPHEVFFLVFLSLDGILLRIGSAYRVTMMQGQARNAWKALSLRRA